MKPRLLIVDDEENLRELYRLELGEEGYEVHTAADAREGEVFASSFLGVKGQRGKIWLVRQSRLGAYRSN